MKNSTTYRVIYGDTDQMGVVYYANYLRWFELGRTEFLRGIGVPYGSIEQNGIYFPVIEVSCNYHKPAHFDDFIIIETTLTSLGRASLTFSYELYRQESRELIATGWTMHACVNRAGQVAKMPPPIKAKLKEVILPAF
jgi:acyl-CoA thioester hydrolase